MNAFTPSLHASITRMLAEPVTCNDTLPGTSTASIYRHAMGLGLESGYLISEPEGVQATHPPHPDQALLDHCALLREQQAEWQRRWAVCPDEPDLDEPSDADQAFDEYSDQVWPGVALGEGEGSVGRLLEMPATTLGGIRAKAAALAAIDEAGDYVDGRCDECQLLQAFNQEVAGPEYCLVTEVRVPPAAEPHPDQGLLDVCARLRARAVEWRRLYELTSDDPELTTPADHEWNSYDGHVWPGASISRWDDGPPHPDDLVAQLRLLQATTYEGMRAKAAAILEHEDAGRYTGDTRADSISIMLSLLEDVAADTALVSDPPRKKAWRT